MADDENREDPPWGKPLQPDDVEGDQPTAEQQRATGPDEPGLPTRPISETKRDIITQSPEGEADEPDMRVTGEDVPDNIVEQTREGEEPYQWHSGTKRDHGSTDAIEFIDVKKSFGRNTILNGLNLGIPDNQISMILGPSGTGKSVCIKHMVGLLYPDQGDVLVHGESVPNMQDNELFEMRKKFGVLFQDGALFGSMNVLDNTAFPLRQHTDKGEEEILEICHRRLAEVGLQGAAGQVPQRALGRHAQARRASRARWCWTRTSCSSTSPTRASTRCARPCCVS